MIVTGEAADALDLGALPFPVVRRREPPNDAPRASSIGRIARSRAADDADAVEPLYVRPPDIMKPGGG
jgi:hypothetical protein